MTMTQRQPIAGTTIFDGVEASKGYALNKMCFSFNSAENRRAFLADEEGYCTRFGLTGQQRWAVRRHSNYHIPISNTASAVMLLENAA